MTMPTSSVTYYCNFSSVPEGPHAEKVAQYDDYDVNVAKDNREIRDEKASKIKMLIFFGSNSTVRRMCRQIVGSSSNPNEEKRNLYNWFIFLCILLGALLTTIDTPVRRCQNDPLIAPNVFLYLDNIILGIFVIDILIRIIAEGLFILPTSYLRNNWNVFDTVVVTLQLVAAFGPLMGDSRVVPLIQSMRGLRLFRIIRYFEGVRILFVDLFHGIPNMICAGVLMLLMYIPFAIYGVNIFGGRFYYCNDGDAEVYSDCLGEFVSDDVQSIYLPRNWANPYTYSYDSFGVALLHLIQIASGEGWVCCIKSLALIP